MSNAQDVQRVANGLFESFTAGYRLHVPDDASVEQWCLVCYQWSFVFWETADALIPPMDKSVLDLAESIFIQLASTHRRQLPVNQIAFWATQCIRWAELHDSFVFDELAPQVTAFP